MLHNHFKQVTKETSDFKAFTAGMWAGMTFLHTLTEKPEFDLSQLTTDEMRGLHVIAVEAFLEDLASKHPSNNQHNN